MSNQHLIIISVIIIVAILFAIVMVSNKIEFAKVKAKTHTYEDLPGFIKSNFKTLNEILPKRGLYFFSDINYPEEFIVDADKKTVKYSLKPHLEPEKKGTLKLSDKQINEIVSLVNKIWASESDYESVDFTARVTMSTLVLVDKDAYRWFDFGGLLVGEVKQLNQYLLNLVPE